MGVSPVRSEPTRAAKGRRPRERRRQRGDPVGGGVPVARVRRQASYLTQRSNTPSGSGLAAHLRRNSAPVLSRSAADSPRFAKPTGGVRPLVELFPLTSNTPAGLPFVAAVHAARATPRTKGPPQPLDPPSLVAAVH